MLEMPALTYRLRRVGRLLGSIRGSIRDSLGEKVSPRTTETPPMEKQLLETPITIPEKGGKRLRRTFWTTLCVFYNKQKDLLHGTGD